MSFDRNEDLDKRIVPCEPLSLEQRSSGQIVPRLFERPVQDSSTVRAAQYMAF